MKNRAAVLISIYVTRKNAFNFEESVFFANAHICSSPMTLQFLFKVELLHDSHISAKILIT